MGPNVSFGGGWFAKSMTALFGIVNEVFPQHGRMIDYCGKTTYRCVRCRLLQSTNNNLETKKIYTTPVGGLA